jgi:DNA polymerase elongation subunit (family B)
MRTLIDLYGDSDDIAENLVMYFGIEVRKNGRYSTVEEASNEINAISFVTNRDDKYKILLLDEGSDSKKYVKRIKVIGTDVEVDCDVEVYTSEIQLLKAFLKYLRNIDPTIITGWNTDFFDIPYLYNRIEKILGRDYSNMLSPINVVRKSNYMGKDEIVIAGLYNLDYLNLYKKFTYSEEPPYRLDAIAKKELGIGKIEYEGSLDDLWRDDPDKFISYSVIDTWLIKQMDLKLDYIDIACGICHKGHVPYSDITFTSKYLEGALLTHLHRQNLVAVRSGKSKDNSKAEGAYVKEPSPGVYRRIYDLDLTSLYPWNIISLNISPETKFGHIYQWDQKAYLSKSSNDDRPWIILKKGDKAMHNFFEDLDEINENEIRFSSTAELKQYLIDNNKSISSAGIIYNLDKIGLIPDVLRRWFAERTEYSNLMKEYGLSGNSEKERYYDKKQLVTKILLNSLYGVLLLPTFRLNFKVSSSLNTYSNQEFVSNGNIVKLTSVQRLSDGEIFSINDKVRFYSKITEIESIYFNEHNQLSFKVKGDRAPLVGVFMNNHPHFTKVKKLFTSKDGVEIYDGDTYYAVYNDFEYLKQEAILNFNLDNAVLRFSTKEAAEEYILMNKPCLSIEEIAPIFGMYHLDNSKTSLDRLTEKLKELVKSKK